MRTLKTVNNPNGKLSATTEIGARARLDYNKLREFSYALYRNNESDRADRCFQDAAVIEAQLLIGLAQNKLDEARQMDVSSKGYKRMLNSACSLAQQAKKVFDRA